MIGPNLLMLCIVLAIPAIIFSILSWRLRTDVMFWLGVVFTGLQLIVFVVNAQLLIYLLSYPDSFVIGLILLSLLGMPVYFLIQSKTKKSNNRGDSDVTDDYLTKIIDSEDEDLDYEK